MSKNKIFILSGFSGSGKDTVLNELLIQNPKLHPVISFTSRPVRDGEKDGREYNFISKVQFLKAIDDGQMLEYRTYDIDFNGKKDTWYYGVSKKSISKDESQLVILDIKGVRALKNLYGDDVVSIFLHAEDNERELRAKKRGNFDETEWNRRLKDDRKQFQDIDICDYVLENIDIEKTFIEVQNILETHR